ncbi:MAG TPA: SsrA-binding protein SmpB [Actinomycetota bacterium]|jgi:SsrA-binding protein|nr:SsrA-binding protein SmpB [Actinomycetota bacterium]
MPKDSVPTKLIAQNRRARFDYLIEETVEAGLMLVGTEVKSCRNGKVSLNDSYATVRDGEAWLLQCHISPYSHGNRSNHDPLRPRKLLLHRAEVERLAAKVAQDGRTLVPTRLYFKHGLAKAEIAVAKGKRTHDKRQATAQREAERRMRQELGRRR